MTILETIKQRKEEGRLKVRIRLEDLKESIKETEIVNIFNWSEDVEDINCIYNLAFNLIEVNATIKY